MVKKELKKQVKRNPAPLSLPISTSIFFIIAMTFYYKLDQKTGAGFGFREIIFSLVIAILLFFFFIWLIILIRKNSYLGIAVSLGIVTLLDYSVLMRFRGPNTTIFLLIFSTFYIIYIIYLFFRIRKDSKKQEYEYDDKI